MTEVVWPAIGSRWKDRKYPERVLTVTATQPKCPLGRNVLGTIEFAGLATIRIGNSNYATDMQTFMLIWESV